MQASAELQTGFSKIIHSPSFTNLLDLIADFFLKHIARCQNLVSLDWTEPHLFQ